MGVARVREPVPVFNFFQYGKPYPLLISSRTRYSFLSVREPVDYMGVARVREPVPVFNFFQYGKPYPLSISSRTSFTMF